ncbi:MAG: hypothetical protein AAFQ02_11350 [Bacteroidota bacterium]
MQNKKEVQDELREISPLLADAKLRMRPDKTLPNNFFRRQQEVILKEVGLLNQGRVRRIRLAWLAGLAASITLVVIATRTPQPNDALDRALSGLEEEAMEAYIAEESQYIHTDYLVRDGFLKSMEQ